MLSQLYALPGPNLKHTSDKRVSKVYVELLRGGFHVCLPPPECESKLRVPIARQCPNCSRQSCFVHNISLHFLGLEPVMPTH